jgi:hypothetical protein
VIALLARPAVAQTVPSDDTSSKRLEWREEWPRFRQWEYVVTGASLVGLASIVALAGYPGESSEYRNGFDDFVRDVLRGDSRETRDHARAVGDFGFRFLNLYPYFDSLVVAGLIHWNGDVAFQTFMIDTEAFAIAGFVTIGFERLVGRARPSARECEANPNYEKYCGEEDLYSSFSSGHTAIAFAGAGLTCAHHAALPLYGSRVADIGACVLAGGIAISSAVARGVNDRHWGSDLLLGSALGTFTGFFMPMWLHYDAGSERPREASSHGIRWMVLPEMTPERAAFRLIIVQ